MVCGDTELGEDIGTGVVVTNYDQRRGIFLFNSIRQILHSLSLITLWTQLLRILQPMFLWKWWRITLSIKSKKRQMNKIVNLFFMYFFAFYDKQVR